MTGSQTLPKSPETGDETERVRRLMDHATSVLGSSCKALDWINHHSAALCDKPVNLAQSEEGLTKALLHLSSVSRHRDSGW